MKQMAQQRKLHRTGLLAGALGLIAMVFAAQSARAQEAFGEPQGTKAQANAPVTTFEPAAFSALTPGMGQKLAAAPAGTEEEGSTPKKPGGEGVKVHGHWLLVLKNADGTVVDRREFENSLITTSTGAAPSGSQLMVAMLSGNATVGAPAIGFVQGTIAGDQSQFCTRPATLPCYVFTSSQSLWNTMLEPVPFYQAGISLGLTSTAVFTPNPAMVLSGNFTVPSGLTSIAAVQSLYGLCVPVPVPGYVSAQGTNLTGSTTFLNADVSPTKCSLANPQVLSAELPFYGALTSTAVTSGTPAVATPLPVTTGQVITVTVTLSFS